MGHKLIRITSNSLLDLKTRQVTEHKRKGNHIIALENLENHYTGKNINSAADFSFLCNFDHRWANLLQVVSL